jgi:hypothetical protein
MHGNEDGETGVDDDVAAQGFENAILTQCGKKRWSADRRQEYHHVT